MASFTNQTKEWIGTRSIPSVFSVSSLTFTGVTATAADPTVFTATGHTLSDGDSVTLSGFTEMTEANGVTGVVEADATNTFQIKGFSGDPEETTGGTVVRSGSTLSPSLLTEAVEQTTLSLLGVDPTKVHLYADGTPITIVSGTTAPDTDQIITIDADGRSAKQISFESSKDAADSDSIYFATDYSPVWWLEKGIIKVLPAEGITAWTMVKVGGQSVTTANEIAGAVTGNFPTRYLGLLPLYCAERILAYWQADMRNDIPALSNPAAAPLTRAAYEALSVDDGWEIVRYLIETEEDVELAQAKISQIGQEQQQWYKDYEWMVQQLQVVKGEYMRRLGAA
ncbi:hypothetical protein CL614_04175 [archaeon]|nr:hypothetical protein [archaeon]